MRAFEKVCAACGSSCFVLLSLHNTIEGSIGREKKGSSKSLIGVVVASCVLCTVAKAIEVFGKCLLQAFNAEPWVVFVVQYV